MITPMASRVWNCPALCGFCPNGDSLLHPRNRRLSMAAVFQRGSTGGTDGRDLGDLRDLLPANDRSRPYLLRQGQIPSPPAAAPLPPPLPPRRPRTRTGRGELA